MYKFVWGFCFYVLWHSVVGDDTYSLYTKLGGTLPVLKYEIRDFFFARLGTGRTSLFLTSQRMPSRYVAYINIYNFIYRILL